MNIQFKHTHTQDGDFKNLIGKLDAYLATINGENNAFFVQHNAASQIQHVLIAYVNDQAVGCGALKHHNGQTIEIKRMFVLESMRGKGIAVHILNQLETWAKTLQYRQCILETAKNMPEAIRLYQKSNYTVIPNYGPYKNLATSICFKKEL